VSPVIPVDVKGIILLVYQTTLNHVSIPSLLASIVNNNDDDFIPCVVS